MDAKRQSLQLDTADWLALAKIAHVGRCTYRGKPSWRRLIHQIAKSKHTMLNKPNKQMVAFQKTIQAPEQDQRLAKIKARMERDRLRQEQQRRAAGILPLSTPPPPMPTAKVRHGSGTSPLHQTSHLGNKIMNDEASKTPLWTSGKLAPKHHP
jgi:hypothetical protein